MSANWTVALTWDTIFLFDATSSRRKWYLVQMCLVLDENAVLPESWRAPMLSSYIITENWRNVNPTNQTYTASWLAYAGAIYSDSHDESATTCCFFELHVSGPPANIRSIQVTRNGAKIVGIVAVANIRISVNGKILRVPHTEIWRSLKVSEDPLRGHHIFILRIAHRPS